MLSLWEKLTLEGQHHHNSLISASIDMCEKAKQALVVATQWSNSGATDSYARRSLESVNFAPDSFNNMRSSFEKENVVNSNTQRITSHGARDGSKGTGMGGHSTDNSSAEAFNILQQLAFEMDPSKFLWEIQMTYCGTGALHYHEPRQTAKTVTVMGQTCLTRL